MRSTQDRERRPAIVAIQPAYGDAWIRRQFRATLDEPVSFTEPRCRQVLTPDELSCLAERHPDGRAACWGGTRSQHPKIIQLERGDLVVLTGQRHVRGVGEVGAVVDNPGFAGALWEPRPGRCTFDVVYSLTWFRRVEVGYRFLQAALGTSERDNFQAMRLVRDRRRVDAVVGLLDGCLREDQGPQQVDDDHLAPRPAQDATIKQLAARGRGSVR